MDHWCIHQRLLHFVNHPAALLHSSPCCTSVFISYLPQNLFDRQVPADHHESSGYGHAPARRPSHLLCISRGTTMPFLDQNFCNLILRTLITNIPNVTCTINQHILAHSRSKSRLLFRGLGCRVLKGPDKDPTFVTCKGFWHIGFRI